MEKVINLSTKKKELCNMDQMVHNLLEEQKMLYVPIDIVQLAIALGFSVREASLTKDNISSIMAYKNNRPIIFVNENLSYVRKRFAIAHILAHFVLGHAVIGDERFTDVFVEDTRTPQEIEANKCAAALLLDVSGLKKLMKTYKELNISKEQMTKSVTNLYQISPQILDYRLKSLKISY